MGMRTNANLLQFLERRAPVVLQSIRRDDPDNYQLQRAAVMLKAGSSEVRQIAALEPTQRLSALRLVQAYTEAAVPAISGLVSAIDQRLITCQRLKIVGGVVAVISGAAAVVLPSLGYAKESISIWSAMFSCVGGLLTLFAGVFERSPNGQRLSTGDYQMLVNHRAELRGIERRIAADAVFHISDQDLVKMHDRSAEIADEIAKLEP